MLDLPYSNPNHQNTMCDRNVGVSPSPRIAIVIAQERDSGCDKCDGGGFAARSSKNRGGYIVNSTSVLFWELPVKSGRNSPHTITKIQRSFKFKLIALLNEFS